MAPVQYVPAVLGPMPDWAGDGVGKLSSITQSALPASSACASSNSALAARAGAEARSEATRNSARMRSMVPFRGAGSDVGGFVTTRPAGVEQDGDGGGET